MAQGTIKRQDYIPKGMEEFDTWVNNLNNRVSADAATWNINPGAVTGLQTRLAEYAPLYAVASNPNGCTKAQRQAYNAKRKQLTTEVRAFVNEWLRSNSLISNESRLLLRINVKDTSKTIRQKIEGDVFFTVKSQSDKRFKFICRRDEDSNRSSMHPDADLVEVKFKIGEAPANVKQCDQTEVSKKAIFTIQLDEEVEIPDMFHCYLRWKNASEPSKSGPWSTRQSVAIQ